MSEEVPEQQPDSEEESELDMAGNYTSPLRTMLTEMHEVYQELILVGFPQSVAVQVLAHMIQDAMLYRSVDEDDDDDLDNDGSDLDDDRGFE